ncbi:EAL domain-containing protein [Methylomonas sp. AM2-LC]|uniref:EAL domain-containing protein n=1 Tax=Methylomonas sp. AM2-LC TaxID=3153301 RepID=UPI0032671E2E
MRIILFLSLLFFKLGSVQAQNSPHLRFGVLSFRPLDITRSEWQPLTQLLETALQGQQIDLLPMHLDELEAAVKMDTLDFMLINPECFVLYRNNEGASAIATLIPFYAGRPAAEYAGVVFTRADRSDIDTIYDITGKTVAAVGEKSLGGFMMQRWEFAKVGLQNIHYQYTGMPQDRVVEQVLAGQADVGLVRSGILETLKSEGHLSLNALKIINQHPADNLTFLHSTEHYPEWPFVISHHVSAETARKVAIALLSIKHTDPAAMAAKIAGFKTPSDYTPVETLMLRLKYHSSELKQFELSDVLARYRVPLVISFIAVFTLFALGGSLLRANRRLRDSSANNYRLLENLNASKKVYQGLFEHMSSGVAVLEAIEKGKDFIVRDFNRAAELLENVGREKVLGRRLSIVFPTAKTYGLFDIIKRVWLTGDSENAVICYTSEQEVWRSNYVYRLLTGELVVIYDDISQFKRTESALIDSHDNLQRLLDSMAEGAYGIDTEGKCTFVNKSALRLLGYSKAEELLGKNIEQLFHHLSTDSQQQPGAESKLRQAWLNNQYINMSDEVVLRKDGSLLPVEYWSYPIEKAGRVIGAIATFIDITDRKLAEEKILNLAYYDPLTKLPNRRMLLERFQTALSVSERSRQYGAVLFLDMDKFKLLNDTHGHNYGDLMLIEVAQRIKYCVREVDTVARIGGDEFVVLLENMGETVEEASPKASLIAEKIRTALLTPYTLNNHVHHSSPSIGVCFYFGNSIAVDELIKFADIAMYQAKNSGRNTVRFYDPDLQLAVEARARLESGLRQALHNDELQLHYQIQFDGQQLPIGAEALLRWIHPLRGVVSPAEFIPIAEESMLIIDIGNWVLHNACLQLANWTKHPQYCHLTLAINVSAHQFRMPEFVELVEAAMHQYEIDPALLKLELTESVILNDIADVVAKMNALKALGVSLSLDDFGTGYSSLSYLKQLPIDQIKIDQSFVRDIATDANDAIMVKAIIDMAKNFNLNVIAEGVETETQLEFLIQNGCMAYQGYLFAKPMPIHLMESHLQTFVNQRSKPAHLMTNAK